MPLVNGRIFQLHLWEYFRVFILFYSIQEAQNPTTKPTPPENTREELTALKALDKLLRTYDRRSTPTNDLGNCAKVLSKAVAFSNEKNCENYKPSKMEENLS